MNNIPRYYRTITHLKFQQLYNKLFRKFQRVSINKIKPNRAASSFSWQSTLLSASSFYQITKNNDKNWISDTPLLTYHLNYFYYIHLLSSVQGENIIIKWITENEDVSKISWAPYPVSLRIVNWIKFIKHNNIRNKLIDESLFRQAAVLFKRREYHLLTNHLFKNITALLFAGIYFNQKEWLKWSLVEFEKQLEVQLTIDGFHFELSPTYHLLFLNDLLDIYNLLKSNKINTRITVLKAIISRSLFWCSYFLQDGVPIPINDVNYIDCPTVQYIKEYAEELGIYVTDHNGINKHYPVIKNNRLKLIFYCADHQPVYNPAHSHDDLTSFLLWYDEKPIIIDTGNYCYDETEERAYSRSSAAHNCFTVEGQNQSEMWKVFRIGRMSHIKELYSSAQSISCSHDGYKGVVSEYKRTINLTETGFEIVDRFVSNSSQKYQIYLHFHPAVKINIKNGYLIADNTLRISFSAPQFNIQETDFYPSMFLKKRKKTLVLSGSLKDQNHKTVIESLK